jgi:hypothetical protein
MIVEYIFLAFILYCLIRFVFNFLIPVIRASNRMHSQMRSFQEKNQAGQFDQTSSTYNNRNQQQTTKTKGDYIDFEDVK